MIYLCNPKTNGALVKGLRRLPFTEESRVRIPYVVQEKGNRYGYLFLFQLVIFTSETEIFGIVHGLVVQWIV